MASFWLTGSLPSVSMVEDTTYYPKFEEFCRPHCYVDEHYFPTMLTIRAAPLLGGLVKGHHPGWLARKGKWLDMGSLSREVGFISGSI
uniref:Uncharacterized protein n=1 Tax=Salix viminalis TaxID=40686 RepID=A0A6N2M3I0_SALVM